MSYKKGTKNSYTANELRDMKAGHAKSFECHLIEKLKALKLYNRMLNIVRTMRFRGATDKEITKTLTEAFSFTGSAISVDAFHRSLFAYPDLAAAYLSGRDECLGMLSNYIYRTIDESKPGDEKIARLAFDYMREIDDGTMIKQHDGASLQLSTTNETLGKVMLALGNIGEPVAPDESDLDFDKQQEAEQSDAASQSSAPIMKDDYE